MTTTLLINRNLPAWCCCYCGEPVGYLGRFFAWLFGPEFHNCSRSNVDKHVALYNYWAMLKPAMREWPTWEQRADPFYPVKEVHLTRDTDGQRLVFTAIWNDGTEHASYATLDDLSRSSNLAATLKSRMAAICPEAVFSDEAIVAFDDSGWRQ